MASAIASSHPTHTVWHQGYSRIARPLTILPTFEGNLTFKKRAFGRAEERILAHFRGSRMEAYFLTTNHEYFHAEVLRRIERDPHFMRWVTSEVRRIMRNLLAFTERLERQDLATLPDEKLIGLLQQFHRRYAEIFGYGLINTYDQDLVAAIKDYCDTRWPSRTATRYFTLLTSDTRDTIYEREKRDLLRATEAFGKAKSPAARARIVHRLVEQYGWLYINYEGRARSGNDFEKTLRSLRRNWKTPKQRIAAMRRKKEKLRSEQRSLERRLHIDAGHRRLIRAIRQNAYLREWRKPQSVRSVYIERKLLDELAHRIGVSTNELKFLFPREIVRALKTKRFDRGMLRARMTNAVYDLRKGSYRVHTGQRGRALLQKIAQRQQNEGESVHGLCAFPGSVTGRVRCIRTLADLTRFRKGEIFVGKVTSPDLIPVFDRARAVVTDEGGLTSHAAIVSREMHVPCVVGAKRATALFRDGDTVEVDAQHGIVRRVRVVHKRP